ncbi:microtubule-actin cross-linking factor 1-like isoform X4 [Acropora millepora]|uniref:microtubule-actin cross-linking factor 1-like isoform X4 n=1 Tax=Acropora millepora TaxID=45264 RepID=UPI001CF2C758|nr:microtubule-actin cross-linking factor 1-like isoform X4 [Acropora millepora]
MMSSKSDPRQIYDDLKDQLSKVFKTLKTLETRASKPNFSTEELSSRNCMTAAFKGHKVGECDVADGIDVNSIQEGQARLDRVLKTLQEIQRQKNSKESTVQGAAVGRKTKSKKCLHFGKLEKDITSYKSMIGDILAEAEPVSQTRRFGAVVLQERKIPRSKEEKTKQDLISIISRWNALSKEVFNTSHSIDAFVSEVQMEYSKLRLWNENAEVADSLLMEYHTSHADKPEKLGTTIRAVRMQLHENQAVLENFRKAKPRLHNMREIAVALMRSGRLEEPDADELERVINIVVAKYESIDNRLNASRDRICAEINRLRERMTKQGSSSILRRFSSKRNSSFRRKSSMRKKPEIQKRKETENKNLQVKKESEVVNSSTSTDFDASMETTLVVQTTDKEYREEKSRLRMQREVYQDFDLILKACEKATYDFDIESGWMTSAPLSDTELEKQLHQLLSLKKSMTEFQTEKEKFEKAKEDDKFDNTDKGILDQRVNTVQFSWEKLWGEFIVQKDKLLQQKDVLERFDLSFKAMEKTVADFEVKSIQKFSHVGPNVDELRRQLSDVMRFESDMKKSMSQFQSELERLQKAKQEGLFNYTDNEGLEKKWNYLKTRWNTLGKEHLENRNRLVQELALLDQRQEDKAFMFPPEMKIMNDFDMMVQSINKWMTESEDLVNSLQSRLNSREFKKRILKITERWEELDKIEAKINDINRLGQDISNDSITMETRERIKEKLEALNTGWRETKKILKECIDKEDKEPIGYRGCCCFQMAPRVFHACFYN